jgi:hypothetical protein
MNYPNQPGWKGTKTSLSAALKISPKSGEHLSKELNIYLYSVLPRLSEMKADGMVRESGHISETDRGCDQVVWERVPGESYRDKLRKSSSIRDVRLQQWQVEQIKIAASLLVSSTDLMASAALSHLKNALEFL